MELNKIRSDNLCKVDSCQTKKQKKGFCYKHYSRFLKYNDPLYIIPKKKCTVLDCERPYAGSGFCMKHYDAFKNHGNPLIQKQVWGEQRSKNPLYSHYNHIKSRCYRKTNPRYKYYGAKGILMSNEWLGPTGFNNFCKDMGPKPSNNYSIDRIDSNKGYSKENCRWADAYIQNSNKENVNEVIGVNFHKNCFRAYIGINKKHKHLGSFKTKDEAIIARKQAEITYNIYK